MEVRERRERIAQRKAGDRVLPEPEEGALLRARSGEVLVYDERAETKLDPVNLRAVVLPDGTTHTFETGRFRRAR